MSKSQVRVALAPALLALGAAHLAGRILTPREQLPDSDPVDLREHFSDQQMARGRRFARGQFALGLSRSALDTAALIAMMRLAARRHSPLQGLAAGRPAAATLDPKSGALAGAATAAGMTVALTLPGLPLAALARERSIRVGLTTQSWRDWGADLAKSHMIEGVIAGAGSAGLIALAGRWPRAWWLPAAGGSVLAGTIFSTLAPVLLDPVFNDFTPLPAGETRDDVLALADAAGVKVGEVFSVDASRRTTAANAYVTGLGPTKRIVLFDTLLRSYTRDEVRVVVAHELAHVRHRDVPRSIAFAAITAPAATLALQRLSWVLSTERGTPRALPALALASGVVAAPIGLIANRLSRAVERRADAFSLELSDAPEAFVSFERAIALQNVADIDPPRALTALLATHPPTGERIGAALGYQRRRALLAR
ncbi:MAG: M48 family metallopeptidase [Solirubrobacteraceae bacterium]